MPSIILPVGSGAAESRPFKVKAHQLPLGVSAFDFDGAEELVIHRDQGDGVFRALTDASATMTSADPVTVIEATGTYKLVRDAGTAGGSLD